MEQHLDGNSDSTVEAPGVWTSIDRSELIEVLSSERDARAVQQEDPAAPVKLPLLFHEKDQEQLPGHAVLFYILFLYKIMCSFF